MYKVEIRKVSGEVCFTGRAETVSSALISRAWDGYSTVDLKAGEYLLFMIDTDPDVPVCVGVYNIQVSDGVIISDCYGEEVPIGNLTYPLTVEFPIYDFHTATVQIRSKDHLCDFITQRNGALFTIQSETAGVFRNCTYNNNPAFNFRIEVVGQLF